MQALISQSLACAIGIALMQMIKASAMVMGSDLSVNRGNRYIAGRLKDENTRPGSENSHLWISMTRYIHGFARR